MSKKKYRTRPISHSVSEPAHKPASSAPGDDAIRAEYKRRGGERIDRDIARLERLLEVHDAEVIKLLEGDMEKHRWKVSPAMVLRIQREIDALQARKDALLKEIEAHPEPYSRSGLAFMPDSPMGRVAEQVQRAVAAAAPKEGGGMITPEWMPPVPAR